MFLWFQSHMKFFNWWLTKAKINKGVDENLFKQKSSLYIVQDYTPYSIA